jgi:hypothetical protein
MSVSWLLSINGAAGVSPESLGIEVASRNLRSLAPSTLHLRRVPEALTDAPIMTYKDKVIVSRVTQILGATLTSGSPTVGLPAGTLPTTTTGGILQAAIHSDGMSGFDFSCSIYAWVDPSGNLYGICSSYITANRAVYNNLSGTVLHWRAFPVTGTVNMGTLHLTSLSGSGVCDPDDSTTPGVTLSFGIGASIDLRPGGMGVFGLGPTAMNGTLSGGVSASLSGNIYLQGFFFDSTVISQASKVVSVGSSLSGTSIPANTVVNSLNGGSRELTMSHNASANGTVDITVTTQWFVGKCTDAKNCEATSSSLSLGYTISDVWWDLSRRIYRQVWNYTGGTKSTARVLIPAHINAGVYDYTDASAISTVSALSELLTWAAARESFTLASISGSGITMPPEEHVDTDVATIAKSILRYHPSAVSWFDYATTPPTLHFATDDDGIGTPQLGDEMLLTQVLENESTQRIRPRYDLLLEGVSINFEYQSSGATGSVTDTASGQRWANQVYPASIDPDDPPSGVLLATLTLNEGSIWDTQVPVPSLLAQRIFEQHQTLQHEGGISLVDEDPGGRSLMGSVLAITGSEADPEWQSMRAWIQSVSEDLRSGSVSIQIGPKPTMGLATWQRLAALHSGRSMPGGRSISQAQKDTVPLSTGGETTTFTVPGFGTFKFNRGLLTGGP